MDIHQTIRTRRSPSEFTARVPTREEIERLLDAAIMAPNHKMTQPWHFYVFGDEARQAYAELRGELKSQKVEDPEVRRRVREKVSGAILKIPALLAVAMRQDEDPMTREEDYAATWMAIQNLLLEAHGMGLAGYIHTGRIMDRPALRDALGVPEEQRVVALIDLGEPEELPAPKPRDAARERTTWTA